MLTLVLKMMTDKEVTDNGMGLLRLASREFYFTAEYAGLFLQMCKDTTTRVNVMTSMYPRIVDLVNVQHMCFDFLTKAEMGNVERNLGLLLHFTPRCEITLQMDRLELLIYCPKPLVFRSVRLSMGSVSTAVTTL